MNTNETISVLTGLLNTLSALKDKDEDVKDLMDHTKQTLDKMLNVLNLSIK